MATHNGWANYETWNVALWLGNDERFYRNACAFARSYTGRITAKAARSFVADLMPNGTPDTKAMSKVRWGAIASFLSELR